ncbi:MAG: 4Fe-4S cluster-binding domain-containing protein [Fervidobacterium sp.]
MSQILPLPKVSPLVRAVKVLYGDHPELPSVSVYFQGCDATPKCFNCHNPETWTFSSDFSVDFDYLESKVLEKLGILFSRYPRASLALLGGEPLSMHNRVFAYKLAKVVKERYQDRVVTILYTWRLPKDLLDMDIPLEYFDEFVMGRYMREYAKEGFPASKNQIYLDSVSVLTIIDSLKKVWLNRPSLTLLRY